MVFRNTGSGHCAREGLFTFPILDIHTATGQYVFSKKWNTTPPTGLHEHISLPLLPAGLYFYTMKNGSQEIVGEIVKIY
jgi:hypothetical protein